MDVYKCERLATSTDLFCALDTGDEGKAIADFVILVLAAQEDGGIICIHLQPPATL
ncbi:unnamed protein product [Taenia asiatica]|uniref:Uncharacterized protein n=1 Tax=Taenia asiatica TaxID=60517 RepID=A0A0R3VZQ9_TAEAS|nr:unnamed protein product [Taenia asiatica]